MNATAAPRNRALTRSVRRVLIVGVLALAGVLGFVTPASAAPGEASVRVTCLPGRLVIMPIVAVHNGYFNGQYVSYRYYLENNHGYKGTSGWAGAQLVPYTTTSWGSTSQYGTTPLQAADLRTATGTHWNIYVQLAYWNPNAYAWSITPWYTPSMVTTRSTYYNYDAPHATCLT